MLHPQEYKAALALNNQGVCLLELQCYREAADTFNHAFALLRPFVAPAIDCSRSTGSTHPTPATTYDMINKILAETSQKLYQSKTRKSRKQQRGDCFQHSIVTDDKTVNRAMVEAALCNPTSHQLYYIRIDDMDGECDLDDANLHLEAAIILYNLATSCRGYASIALAKNKTSVADKQLSRCQVLYQLVLKVLNQGETKQVVESARFLLLSMLALQGLMHIPVTHRCVEDGRQYYIQLGEARSLFNDMDLLIFCPNDNLKQDVAAAAA